MLGITGAEHTWKEGSGLQPGTSEDEQDVALETAAAKAVQRAQGKTRRPIATRATTGECSKNQGFIAGSCCKSCVQLGFQAFKKAGVRAPR